MEVAPAFWYKESSKPDPSPALCSTSTRWLASVNARTPAGVRPTRYSLSLISFGSPMITVSAPGVTKVFLSASESLLAVVAARLLDCCESCPTPAPNSQFLLRSRYSTFARTWLRQFESKHPFHRARHPSRRGRARLPHRRRKSET